MSPPTRASDDGITIKELSIGEHQAVFLQPETAPTELSITEHDGLNESRIFTPRLREGGGGLPNIELGNLLEDLSATGDRYMVWGMKRILL